MDKKRYTKQIILSDVGEAGQKMLRGSHACVVGAGGLGSPVIYYLAAAGIGSIHIIDSDVVELSNLNRQLLHFERDLGEKKAVSAKNKINAFNSEIDVSITEARLDDSNATKLLSGYDIVLSCADNLNTRRFINKACASLEIPMVDGGIGAFSGYCLTVIPGSGPCYECIFGEAKQKPSGVIGAAAGVIGSMMALRAIEYLLEMREAPDFLVADLKTFKFESIKIEANPACPVCGHGV